MTIINYLCVGEEVKNIDEMPPEEKREVATKLNEQALKGLGYRKCTDDKTA